MESNATFCINHPDRETSLRCNKCGQPICSACAVLTPVGYRCKTCVRSQQKIFETAFWYDYPIAFFLAAILAGIGSILSMFISIFIIFIAYFAGEIIARAVQWGVRYRRGRYLRWVAVAGTICGVLPLIAVEGFSILMAVLGGYPQGLFDVASAIAWPLVFAGITAFSVAAALRRVQI